MIGVLFLIIIFAVINQAIFGVYKKRHPWFSKKKMNYLYLYHLFFYGVYTWYAYNNPSDSKQYFQDITFHTGTWFDLFGTDTTFINFVAYPFFKMGFSYDMLMLTFAWFGFLGFVYAYMFFRENIPIKIKVFKSIDLLSLILFFPNMHFWTASLGKGSAIFLGLMIFTYAIVNMKSRIGLLVLGSILIFYIRPHVFLFVAIGTVLGYMSGREKIALWKKIAVYVVMIGTLLLVQDQILAVMGLQDSENLVEDFHAAAETRSEDLSTSGSGVNMSSYPLPLKLFTFWFRPLFFDAPGLLGLITSVENFIYLLLFFKILKKDFIKFIRTSPSFVKMSFVIFFTTSLAMTFVMSNLGIIMREKTMVMYYLFFVIYYYLAQIKYKKLVRLKKQQLARKLKGQKERELSVV